MTGYQSKKAMARDKLKCQCSMTTKLVGSGCQYCNPEYMDDDDAQPEQEPMARDKLAHMTFEQRCRVSEQCLPEAPYRAMLVALHDEMLEALAQPEQEPVGFVDSKLNPIQRPWVGLTEGEWFDWWRVSPVANETEVEIDFADFLIIAQAVVAKLKELNNG